MTKASNSSRRRAAREKIARSVVDVILGEAAFNVTPEERLRDMQAIASVIMNRAQRLGVTPEEVVSGRFYADGKLHKQFDAYDKPLPKGSGQFQRLAELALRDVEVAGPVNNATYYATPDAVHWLPDGLQFAAQTAGHMYFDDPQLRNIVTGLDQWKELAGAPDFLPRTQTPMYDAGRIGSLRSGAEYAAVAQPPLVGRLATDRFVRDRTFWSNPAWQSYLFDFAGPSAIPPDAAPPEYAPIPRPRPQFESVPIPQPRPGGLNPADLLPADPIDTRSIRNSRNRPRTRANAIPDVLPGLMGYAASTGPGRRLGQAFAPRFAEDRSRDLQLMSHPVYGGALAPDMAVPTGPEAQPVDRFAQALAARRARSAPTFGSLFADDDAEVAATADDEARLDRAQRQSLAGFDYRNALPGMRALAAAQNGPRASLAEALFGGPSVSTMPSALGPRELGAMAGAAVPARAKAGPAGVADPFGNYIAKDFTERLVADPTSPRPLEVAAAPLGFLSTFAVRPEYVAPLAPRVAAVDPSALARIGSPEEPYPDEPQTIAAPAPRPASEVASAPTIAAPRDRFPPAPDLATTFPAPPRQPEQSPLASIVGPRARAAFLGGAVGGLPGALAGALLGGGGLGGLLSRLDNGPMGPAGIAERFHAGYGMSGIEQGMYGPRGATGTSLSNPGAFAVSRGPGQGWDLTNELGVRTTYSPDGHVVANRDTMRAWGGLLGSLFGGGTGGLLGDRSEGKKDKDREKRDRWSGEPKGLY
jgi:hypothetical protein